MSDIDFLRIVFMLGEVYGSLYQEEFRDRYRLNQVVKVKSFIEKKVKGCKACKGLALSNGWTIPKQ